MARIPGAPWTVVFDGALWAGAAATAGTAASKSASGTLSFQSMAYLQIPHHFSMRGGRRGVASGWCAAGENRSRHDGTGNRPSPKGCSEASAGDIDVERQIGRGARRGVVGAHADGAGAVAASDIDEARRHIFSHRDTDACREGTGRRDIKTAKGHGVDARIDVGRACDRDAA